MKVDKITGEQILLGSSLYGAGGGGLVRFGRQFMNEALAFKSEIPVKSFDEMGDDDIIISAATVGAPSNFDVYVNPDQWKVALVLMEETFGGKIAGLCNNEMGGMAACNCWTLAAMAGIPLVDCACTSRAVPYSPMACMTLGQREGFLSTMTVCGGKGDTYIKMSVQGKVYYVTKVIRQASANINGSVLAVLRNPMPVSYMKENAAVGALTLSLKAGEVLQRYDGKPKEMVKAIEKEFNFEYICEGAVENYKIMIEGGLDVGSFFLKQGKNSYEMRYWNEYMTFENNGERLGTFPDAIITLDAATGLPFGSAELSEGQKVIIGKIHRKYLLQSPGLYVKDYLEEVERAVDRKIVEYIL